jgi:LysM repeat protein
MKKLLVYVTLVALLLGFVVPTWARVEGSGPRIHVVQPGETLFSIARWYGMDVGTLARANNIVNPNRIYVGQRLVIPTGAPTQPPSTGVYVVKPGDTLYSIARYYGITAWAIAQANGIYNMNHIYVGQRLVIPGAAPPPTPKPKPSTPSPGTTPAPSGRWWGEYYNGTDLSGGPLFTRSDYAVNFHWGQRAPDTRLNTDHFSVHWTRTVNYRGGVYRFKLTVDDGARLYIDGELVLDHWEAGAETTHEVDVTLTPGNHLVAVDYFEETGTATIQLSFRRLGAAPPEVTPTPTPTGPVAPVDAWLGEYFGNSGLAGDPVITQRDGNIGFEWGLDAPMVGIPSDHFSVRWSRQAEFYADNYIFCAMADDGVRLLVDDTVAIDEWHGANALTYCTELDIAKGLHDVTVEYYEDGGEALIYVWWERR